MHHVMTQNDGTSKQPLHPNHNNVQWTWPISIVETVG